MLKIVMDTAGDLPEGWQAMYDIDLIPINIIHGGKSYLQGIDISYEDFYQMVEKEGIIPSTSQPSPNQFIKFYRQIANSSDEILSIHVTEKLSGTMDSANQAAQELKNEFSVTPFDSASGSLVMGLMAKEARVMDQNGKSLQEIINRLERIRDQHRLVFTLDTLKFARMSGRIKYLQAALAALLKVKPIIELKKGILEMGKKVRSHTQAVDLLLNKIEESFGDKRIIVGVVHAHDHQAGVDLLQHVIERFNCAEAILGELTISLAAHFGPGTLGLAAYPVEE
ncbi:MAG: DegV family protein [Anaerolineaceae bacterium]|nr:DegV family protein [Anaerolineaceae bacterium]